MNKEEINTIDNLSTHSLLLEMKNQTENPIKINGMDFSEDNFYKKHAIFGILSMMFSIQWIFIGVSMCLCMKKCEVYPSFCILGNVTGSIFLMLAIAHFVYFYKSRKRYIYEMENLSFQPLMVYNSPPCKNVA